ncbi:PepSY-associated TM helix domain-containing protein [Nocardia camponoti]|uniref:Peptidase n=1 Tax=Nocardia camponoti TaxID=1616106 RepID=A0A917QDG8_9NOCA|nr:PepSY domain-containing protein [Nocardia camponoti]GGK45138.1 peptidase [Nocardia camponoti]
MSIIDIVAPASGTDATPPRRGSTRRRNLYPLAQRLHFFAGIFVAPFLLIAALTGALYAIAPTIENVLSADLLRVETTGPTRPLAEQVSAAVATKPDLNLVAVAPAVDNETTRVLFVDPTLGESERLAVFVDPHTALPVGESVVYGSSGALPMRAWLSELHRSLHLGEPGRLYSEAAASWLWVIVGFGLILWISRVRKRAKRNSVAWLAAPDLSNTKRRNLTWHAVIGFWVLPIAVLLSATGMTWSTYAGENVTKLREEMSWTTPSVPSTLPGEKPSAAPTSDHHASTAPASSDAAAHISELDRVYATARANGIDRAAEITIPATATKAFVVKEQRRSGTYAIDAVAVDGTTGAVVATLPYAEWPLMAKLTNWGIAFHMGLLFGLPNQLLLTAAMLGLLAVLVLGYVMWWQRRPERESATARFGSAPRRGALRKTSLVVVIPLVTATLVVGWFAPLIGIPLVAFLLIDTAIGLSARAVD